MVASTSVTLVMAELRPNCFVRYAPTKNREIKPVERGTISPEPTPSKALTAISCHILVDSRYNTPLTAKMLNPICNSQILLTFSVSFPDNIIKGIISSEGRDDNICISNSVEWGNMADNFPRIGETANPGSAFSAEIDHIPINVIRGIVPCPVFILIIK